MTEKISSWTDKARIAAEGVETCSFLHVHEEKVVQVQQMMPDDQTLNRLSDLFRVFGDGTRIRILDDTVRRQPSAANTQECTPDTEPQGRKNGVLFSC